MDTGADGGGVFARNDGLFVRRHNTMIDADLQSCAPLGRSSGKVRTSGERPMASGGDWTGHPPRRPHARPHGGHAHAEHRHPTRTPPSRRWVLRPLHRRSAAGERAAPRIATGLFGEWQFLDGSREEWTRDAVIALLPGSHPPDGAQANGSRTTTPSAAARTRRRSPSRSAPPTSRRCLRGGASWRSRPQMRRGIATSRLRLRDRRRRRQRLRLLHGRETSSGMRSAKLFRLTLPESALQWWTNNRLLRRAARARMQELTRRSSRRVRHSAAATRRWRAPSRGRTRATSTCRATPARSTPNGVGAG